jgi:hypothetical protein
LPRSGIFAKLSVQRELNMKKENRKKLPYGERKFIREEKMRVRNSVADPNEQTRLINELLKRYFK